MHTRLYAAYVARKAQGKHMMVAQHKPTDGYSDADSEKVILVAREIVRNGVPEGYEWIDSLSPAHSRMFATELLIAMAQFDTTGNVEVVADLLESWEATAELDVAPEVVALVRRPKENKRYVQWPAAKG